MATCEWILRHGVSFMVVSILAGIAVFICLLLTACIFDYYCIQAEWLWLLLGFTVPMIGILRLLGYLKSLASANSLRWSLGITVLVVALIVAVVTYFQMSLSVV